MSAEYTVATVPQDRLWMILSQSPVGKVTTKGFEPRDLRMAIETLDMISKSAARELRKERFIQPYPPYYIESYIDRIGSLLKTHSDTGEHQLAALSSLISPNDRRTSQEAHKF